MLQNPRFVFQGSSIGYKAKDMLSDEGAIGKVDSIFEKAINVKTLKGGLVSIFRADLSNSPIAIVTDVPKVRNMQALGVAPGDKVTLYEDFLFFNQRFGVSLKNATVWRSRLRKGNIVIKGRVRTNFLKAKNILSREKRNAGLYPLIEHIDLITSDAKMPPMELDITAVSALPIITKFAKAIKMADFAEVKMRAGELTGLGPGLTPSGDDMLAGFMACLCFAAEYCSLEPGWVTKINKIIVDGAHGKTTFISRKFLESAANGEMPEKIENLLEALFFGKPNNITKPLIEVLHVGETSGGDMLFGIFLALTHVLSKI